MATTSALRENPRFGLRYHCDPPHSSGSHKSRMACKDMHKKYTTRNFSIIVRVNLFKTVCLDSLRVASSSGSSSRPPFLLSSGPKDRTENRMDDRILYSQLADHIQICFVTTTYDPTAYALPIAYGPIHCPVPCRYPYCSRIL